MIILASIVVGAVVALVLFSIFFRDVGDFLDCLRLYFTPEIINAFRGEWHDGLWAYAKVWVYFGISIGNGFMTRLSLEKFFYGEM
jgi:hypothetical protein